MRFQVWLVQSAIAATALDSVISELSDPKKQAKLGIIGVAVRDSKGEFRDLADIMDDVLDVAKKEGNIDFLSEVFGVTSMKAVRAFQNYGENYKKLTEDLGNTTGALEAKSARMAGTMKANLQNLQTTFLKFADTNLAAPLEKINNLLSYLSEKYAGAEYGVHRHNRVSPAPRLLIANVRKKNLLQNRNAAANRIWQPVLRMQNRGGLQE